MPKPGPGTLDGSSVGIRSALNVPRSGYVNEQIRAGGSPRPVYPHWSVFFVFLYRFGALR